MNCRFAVGVNSKFALIIIAIVLVNVALLQLLIVFSRQINIIRQPIPINIHFLLPYQRRM